MKMAISPLITYDRATIISMHLFLVLLEIINTTTSLLFPQVLFNFLALKFLLVSWHCRVFYSATYIGSQANLDDLVYEPPRDGPTIWEIGIPDRSAAEFFVPDPNPKYINKLYVNHPDRLISSH